MSGAKLAILGGGGFRVPLVYGALLADASPQRIDRVALYDTDPDRLGVISAVLAQLAAERGVDDPPVVTATTDLDEALDGSDFVFSAIRVGGTGARTRDERVALELGVLGQETVGPGGLAYALRTIPVARQIAERVVAVAPQAYVINFTNPAGIITEAMQAILGERVVGICDTPSALGHRVLALLGLDPVRARLDYVGLNHLGWLRGVGVDGVDRLPDLLGSDDVLEQIEEAQLFGIDWLRALEAIPNEYLYYYYFHRDAVRKISSGEDTRGEFVLRQQQEFYSRAQASSHDELGEWRRTLHEREASYMAEARDHQERPPAARDEGADTGGYEEIALRVMHAIGRNEPATMIVNVRNASTIATLPPDAVIEVPALVDGSGIRPLSTTPPDLHQSGLMQQLKAVEQLIVEAALTGSRDTAVKAFALHPLVDSVALARDLVAAYAQEIPDVGKVLGRPTREARSRSRRG